MRHFIARIKTLLTAWILGLTRAAGWREIQLNHQIQQEIHLVDQR